jgi:CYTH domain-containing protein
MLAHHKFARIERERRFLLGRFPAGVKVLRVRRITDRYVEGTTLRLRTQHEDNAPTIFKLTQKIPALGEGAQQGYITSIDLEEDEFNLLSQLPGRMLSKTRHSVPPFGIDVFEGELFGLILAEAEFDSAEAADSLALPSFVLREVSADRGFTGGSLARLSREELKNVLIEHGISFCP